MREKELAEVMDCKLCGKNIGEAGVPLFWRVKIERHGLDLLAMRRQSGLAMQIGSGALANIMGPDEEMTKPMMEPIEFTVCETCASEKTHCIAYMALEFDK